MSLGLPEPALLILVSLASGPRHGYAIILDVEALCGVRMGPGTLYGAIARLERLGLIEPLPSEDRRRPYRLTESGARALREELATLREVAATGLERLAAT
jgi:DNA-binding PadR family transcriptional regulator